ncbi:RNA-binding KH domain-containing protein isoform 1 [Hibiscus syriacus]|uniref:RNA-binding KH domain-containing protein isoform 1 n=1 Tax=Hibiscus syriacus TaxID=106335 RepID=A0A6A2Y8X9_HIBSY|nr:transcription termination factor MTEF18, mitochondrial-like [Hibiscus syriacus]KAE8673536.1 RNA-binding KH domain-containing protein isoform 1 [Hibiscus syriacus]
MNHFPKFIHSHLLRHFSSLPKLPYFTKIPSKYRARAIEDAQQALTDYLHCTRYIPFVYAEHIAKNSICSLSSLVSGIDFSAPSFNKNVLRFLRYHPINEYEFFFESIGIDYDEVSGLLPSKKFFFSEDETVLHAACALSGFGFPWNKLGKLYKEEALIFRASSKELKARLCRIKEVGFSNISVIGICLAFPYVLRDVGELDGEVAALLNDLRSVFVDFDLGNHVEANVDSWYEICRKMRVFYDLGCQKGEIGELMGRNKSLFLQHSEEVMVKKIEYFCRFLARKEDVGLLILQSPEILDFDLETPVISVMGILKHFGLSADKRDSIAKEYPYVLGRNKMANLPNVMKALNLHEWLFNKIKDGNYRLLVNCTLSDLDEDFDKDFRDSFERIQFSRTPIHTMEKLIFLHKIGFGENSLTMKVLAHVHGTSAELQERFDSLLCMGITFSKLCKMVQTTPKVLNQSPKTIVQKVNFLLYEMGVSLDYLDIFPAFLCFNLEKRIKPRYRLHKWLTENGLCTRNYSIASIVATGEKSFVARLSRIHPDAPKHWLESFSYQEPGDSS